MPGTRNDSTQTIPQRHPMVVAHNIKKGLPIPIGYIASIKELHMLSLPPLGIMLNTSACVANQAGREKLI